MSDEIQLSISANHPWYPRLIQALSGKYPSSPSEWPRAGVLMFDIGQEYIVGQINQYFSGLNGSTITLTLVPVASPQQVKAVAALPPGPDSSLFTT